MFILILLPFLITSYLFKLMATVSKEKKSISGKHVCVTGGSSGIGKSVAVLAAQMGANVTIVARDLKRLELSLEEIEKHRQNPEQVFKTASVDCSDHESVDSLISSIELEDPIYMLVNCVGIAKCGRLECLSEADIKSMVDINYYGTVYPIKYIIPKMKARKDGIIVICGSQAGLCGIFGYSIYSSVKYALRGFAEALHMENRDFNINITLALPPDTDTPGFEIENKGKPVETKLISASAGLYQPDVVAKQLMKDALVRYASAVTMKQQDGKFFSTVGFESWILTTLCVGMSPFTHMFDVIVEAIVLAPLRLISTYYLRSFQRIVTNCLRKEEKKRE